MSKKHLSFSDGLYPSAMIVSQHQTSTGLIVSVDTIAKASKELWSHITENNMSIKGFSPKEAVATIDIRMTVVQALTAYTQVNSVLRRLGFIGHWMIIEGVDCPALDSDQYNSTKSRAATSLYAYAKWCVDQALKSMSDGSIKFNGGPIRGIILKNPASSRIGDVAARASMMQHNGACVPPYSSIETRFSKIASAVGGAIIIMEFSNDSQKK